MICPYGLPRFVRFAREVWGVDPEGKSDEETAAAGLAAMESWMKEMGLALTIGELGATEEMLEGIADATMILDGGYKVLTRDENLQVLRESL
jgi:alcohol dehydrogenase YqhD (iron-dependent ADH family)